MAAMAKGTTTAVRTGGYDLLAAPERVALFVCRFACRHCHVVGDLGCSPQPPQPIVQQHAQQSNKIEAWARP